MPRHPQQPHRPSSADQRSGERFGERMARAHRTRDELANNAWLRFLCEVSTAWDSAKNEASLERIRAAVQAGARKRRLARLGLAMLQALLALFSEMLLAVSFPLVALLTYRYLQMASVQSEKQWEATCEQWRRGDIAAGTSPLEAKTIKDAHMRAFRLGSIVGERARLFPLGQEFQSDIYSFLSDIIHHDFSMAARDARTLDHGDEAIYHGEVVHTMLYLADVLVAAVVTRIRDDIGIGQEVLQKNGQQLLAADRQNAAHSAAR